MNPNHIPVSDMFHEFLLEPTPANYLYLVELLHKYQDEFNRACEDNPNEVDELEQQDIDWLDDNYYTCRGEF